jgi:5-oxoprolinase (ATP-hydrolysing) subunit A
MKTIDVNCDMGELPEAVADGSQEALMAFVTSVNIACGGHAGDPEMMRATIQQAQRWSVAIGAHPGYEDRENFGRLELQLTHEEIAASVYKQVCALDEVAKRCSARLRHVKPHGALYNQAARDRGIARAIIEGVMRWRNDVVLVGLAGSVMLEEFRLGGFAAAAEAFADRQYEADGSLRARRHRDALLHDPGVAAQQALQIVERGEVIAANGSSVRVDARTLCIHGDTPGAAEIAKEIHQALVYAGVALKPLADRTDA